MIQFLAYVPYAAVGYCAAKVAADVWPTLRSQIGTQSYPSSRHGLDGEAYRSRRGPEYCGPDGGGPVFSRNQAAAAAGMSFVAASPGAGCYDESSNTILGGQWDGIQPHPTQVAVWVEDGTRRASIHLGDNRIELPTCGVPATGAVTSTPGEPPLPPGRRTPPRGRPPNGGDGEDPCPPRHMARGGVPMVRQADCDDGTRRNRMARRRMRVGRGG